MLEVQSQLVAKLKVKVFLFSEPVVGVEFAAQVPEGLLPRSFSGGVNG